uniref:GH84 domain-containing protein n=1 Tax=Amazona collaria TaxID=241587 RepID=A0A8B9FCC6_9PSIT
MSCSSQCSPRICPFLPEEAGVASHPPPFLELFITTALCGVAETDCIGTVGPCRPPFPQQGSSPVSGEAASSWSRGLLIRRSLNTTSGWPWHRQHWFVSPRPTAPGAGHCCGSAGRATCKQGRKPAGRGAALGKERALRRGLNCYMYAPKDELKHRLLWREPYTEPETAHMRSLIEAAQERGVEFVFALSAGQDVVFSSPVSVPCLQVAAMGCRAFALLFDDIDPCMCQADRDAFPSLAQAQASVANEVYQELGQPPVFLFCPTEYCSSLCSPSPSQSCYLLTIGRELLPGIGVIWTGPKVVSQELSAVLLEEVEGVLRRRPVIWDNLYANDYDCRRVFLGPYTGRAPGLMARLRGLLLNPNCELQANFIPIHTLGSWFRSELWMGLPRLMSSSSLGMEPAAARGDSQGPQDGSYSPQEALELALTQPEPSRVDTAQTPPGPGAGAHPVPTAPLIDGAAASPVPTASLTLEEARSSPISLLIMEEAGSGPAVALIPKEPRSSPMAPVTPEEPRSSPTAPVTPEEPRSSPTAPVTPEKPRSSPTAPVTPEKPRSSPTAPLTPEEPRSSATAPLTPEEARSNPTAPLTPEEPRSSPTAPLTLGEVRMLVELFYLPYHHGPLAQHLLEHFRWLRANSLSVGVSAAAPDAGAGRCWRGRARSFRRLCAQTCCLHTRLVGAAGRALLYDLHPYLWAIRNVLLAASAFVQWLGCQSIPAPILLQGDAEPWAQRGGLFGELQALLPVGNSSDLFYQPPPLFPSRQLYVLRPLQPRDKGDLYRMCRESLDCDPKVTEILVAHPDLLGDRLLGSFLSLSPEYTFVLEDDAGPCGYAAGVLCAEGFLQQRDSGWLPAMRHKYPRDLAEALLFFHTEPAAVPLPVLRRFPSLVQLGTAARTLDTGASRSLALCLLSSLRANGSRGVFCQVSATDQQQLSFYSKLGFVALPVAWDSCPGARLLGRLL